MSIENCKGHSNCEYRKKIGKSEECFGFCDYFAKTGRTRLGLHKDEYEKIKTEKEREKFLENMNKHCQEYKVGKKRQTETFWKKEGLLKRRRKNERVQSTSGTVASVESAGSF